MSRGRVARIVGDRLRAVMYWVTGIAIPDRQIGSPFLLNGSYLGPPWRLMSDR
jgi:hypothetical protein